MRGVQVVALKGLDASFADDRPRALVAMTMGAGNTFVSVAETYRLLRHGGAKRSSPNGSDSRSRRCRMRDERASPDVCST